MTISFAGTIDGAPFEGGTGDDAVVLIGSNTFIPGFEDQLIGIATGETRTLKVTFPAHYMKQISRARMRNSLSPRNRSRRRAQSRSTTNLPNRSAWN